MDAHWSAHPAGAPFHLEPYNTTLLSEILNDEDVGAPAKRRPGRPSKTDVRPAPRGPRGFRRYRNGLLNVTPVGPEIAIVKRNARESPLLRLPAEVREVIWEHAFMRYEIEPTRRRRQLENFKVLQVCRQIYVEATPISRALITISLKTARNLERMLRQHSLHGLHVHVKIPANVGLEELPYLRRKIAGRFRSLTFTVYYLSWDTDPDKAKHERVLESHFQGIEAIVQHKTFDWRRDP